ncbi:MAG: hypothetical protein AAGD14_18520, partial [Planctomycetota bacterium]
MHGRGAAALLSLVLTACAATVPPPRLPPPGVEPTTEPPPSSRVATDGMSDGPAPRWIELTVTTAEKSVSIGAWCREEVWTPLERAAPVTFVRRQTWSQLGKRKPKQVRTIDDSIWNGIRARLRPTTQGALDFFVEVSAAEMERGATTFTWGASIELDDPKQRTYRFAGRVPAGYAGPVAAWGALSVAVRDEPGDARGLRRTRFTHGFVAGGRRARAEYEELTFDPADPVVREYDGVLQARFALLPRRAAAGFRYEGEWRGTTGFA